VVNVPEGIIDLTQNLTQNLFELALSVKTWENERLQRVRKTPSENRKWEETTFWKLKIRDDNVKREQLADQREKLQIEAGLQREKLLIEQIQKNRDRHAAAMQSYDEMVQVDKQCIKLFCMCHCNQTTSIKEFDWFLITVSWTFLPCCQSWRFQSSIFSPS